MRLLDVRFSEMRIGLWLSRMTGDVDDPGRTLPVSSKRPKQVKPYQEQTLLAESQLSYRFHERSSISGSTTEVSKSYGVGIGFIDVEYNNTASEYRIRIAC